MHNQIKIFYSKDWRDYELLDTGEGEKLERFGPYTFVRPLESALWKKTLDKKEWDKADGRFASSKKGEKPGWQFLRGALKNWEMECRGIKFLVAPTPFRHLGFFPEEASKWDFIEAQIKAADVGHPQKIKFLNLFGYTGVASLFALRAGAEVTHVDASGAILKWTKENADLNNLSMRIIEDDAVKFLEREIKRGNKYDAIIMDPPKFGWGPKGEVWKIEEMLPRLLELSRKALSDKPLFVILTSYTIDASSLTLGYALEEAMRGFSGKTEVGELSLIEKSKNRIIPLANTALWVSSGEGN